MSKIAYFVGIDISKATFAASIFKGDDKSVITEESIPNNPDGFISFVSWLSKHNTRASNSVICMESTGVYAEAVAHYLAVKGFRVAVEPPLKVKRAFEPCGHKTDAVDSKQIAEYAYRFFDELSIWQPKDELLEKIRQLLAVREQFTKQKVATKNAMQAYSQHIVQVGLIKKAHQETLAQLEKQIKRIDKELSKLIGNDPTMFQKTNVLKSIPGCGMLLACNLMAITSNFEHITSHKQLAAFIGIVPYQYQSGTSINKRAKMRHFGPQLTRKLLRLAAQSVATHDRQFRQYYLRKLAEGKAKALVLNNIANKLLKVACAMMRDNKSYIKKHRSIHPMYLKTA